MKEMLNSVFLLINVKQLQYTIVDNIFNIEWFNLYIRLK